MTLDTHYLKQELGIPEDCIVIGNTANLKPIKGHRYLIEAFANVVENNNKLRLVIAGNGPEKENLLALANKLKVRDKFIIANSHLGVFDIMNTFDIFVLPSLAEGFSNALLEAMAAQKPVIATRVGAVKILVENNTTGLLIEPCDIRSLVDAVIDLLGDELKTQRLARNAQEKINKEFSAKKMADNYLALYNYCFC